MMETIVLVREIPFPESATRDANAVWAELAAECYARGEASPQSHFAHFEAAEDFFDQSITYTVRLVPRPLDTTPRSPYTPG